MKDDTILTHAGRDPFSNHGIVNPPVYHASTVLFPTLDALLNRRKGQTSTVEYGRRGTPTIFALQDAMTARSEEHTSELQSLMRISYAVFCLKKKTNTLNNLYLLTNIHH